MATTPLFDFAASASAYSIVVLGNASTAPMARVEIPLPQDRDNSATSRKIELLREVERDEWREIESLIPSDDTLSRVAERFTPPREWFDEEDVL